MNENVVLFSRMKYFSIHRLSGPLCVFLHRKIYYRKRENIDKNVEFDIDVFAVEATA